MAEHARDLAERRRFAFGKNWSRFLSLVDDARIADAEASLKTMLGVESLAGKRFLDAGSGSGLFSLAARRLGAVVHSFDFDPVSVACTSEIKRRYADSDDAWRIEEGSVLQKEYLVSLGQFDVVYSWGVLHHTGAMWRGLENVAAQVAIGGHLFIALYNDQGTTSRYWHAIKRWYVRWPMLRPAFVGVHLLYPFLPSLALRSITGRRGEPRGMSFWRDVIDWVGGLPFEVAAPGAVLEYCQARGFRLTRLVTTNRHGCNEFVFLRDVSR